MYSLIHSASFGLTQYGGSILHYLVRKQVPALRDSPAIFGQRDMINQSNGTLEALLPANGSALAFIVTRTATPLEHFTQPVETAC